VKHPDDFPASDEKGASAPFSQRAISWHAKGRMDFGYEKHLEDILGAQSIGVAILDARTLGVHYINPYLDELITALWQRHCVIGSHVSETVPASLSAHVVELLTQVATTRQAIELAEVPFEGFLELRGRTYWCVTLEYRVATVPESEDTLLVTLKEVTETVRARLQIQAIRAISSAQTGPTSLPLVLERILRVLKETFGSKRCAIFLLDRSLPAIETQLAELETSDATEADAPLQVRLVAQLGIHRTSYNWHVPVDDKVLLDAVVRERRTRILTDTSSQPQLVFPLLNHHGEPHRPGSVLCVPIFEPYVDNLAEQRVFGTVEVYHLRARGFPAKEVALLEQFAQQAGLAIQNARLFRRIDQLARAASRNVRQQESIMQAMPDGVVIVDLFWRIIDINQAARELFSWDEKVLGRGLIEVLEHSQVVFQHDLFPRVDTLEEIERRALAGGNVTFKLIGAEGGSYTIQATYTPIRDALGDIFAFSVIYHDISEQVADLERIEARVVERTAELKLRNQALQEAQEAQAITNARMSLLLGRLPSGVILISAHDMSITVINRQAVELLQRLGAKLPPMDDPEEAARRVIGQDGEQILRAIALYYPSGSLLPYEEHPFYAAIKRGESGDAELHVQRTDGQSIYLLVNAAPLRAPDGSIESAILVYQDITHLKQLEHVREDFFTMMAHELKTPLANIRAHLSALLVRDVQWTREEQFDYLQTADEQVDRLVGMINHFLEASRVEAGALRLDLEPILLPELFEDVQERLEALISAAHCTLQIIMPEQVPAVRGDYELLLSVLTNLLSNAFRYAPEGDAVQLLVELVGAGPGQKSHSVKISVIDRGPGISREQQIVLFKRFSSFAALSHPLHHSVETHRQKATRWSPATGLGLYISRGIIDAHGSQLELTSSQGHGATFAFTLPIYREKRKKARPTKPLPITSLTRRE
jgi:PAS domain S-box-containing protein